VTPVETLRSAADRLESLAKAAQKDLETDDFWACYNPATAWRDGMTNGMGGVTGDLAGAIPPAAVAHLVHWLRAEARQPSASPYALAFASRIHGT
jgi:hypothetical protein